MVSPLTGKAIAAEVPAGGPREQVTESNLRDRLSRSPNAEVAKQ